MTLRIPPPLERPLTIDRAAIVSCDRLPREGERCVVVGWPLGENGRKLFAGTALHGEGGDVLAVARQVWIAPPS